MVYENDFLSQTKKTIEYSNIREVEIRRTVTDRIMNDTFWIGVYPGMTDEMIDYMAKTIIDACKQ